jgi:deoxyribose-phosphate aldolase
VTRTVEAIAKTIDHALLQPAQTDRQFQAGCELAIRWSVASVCVRSTDVRRAQARVRDSSVAVCAVVGFPHGNAPNEIICLEAQRALECGANEIDAVLTLSHVLSDDWIAVQEQIESLNAIVVGFGGLLKVILETGLIAERDHKIRLCEICRKLGVAYVKTSTGFAIGRDQSGSTVLLGATIDDVGLLVKHAGPTCLVKASGGIRAYRDAIAFLSAGAARLGTASTESILVEASRALARD